MAILVQIDAPGMTQAAYEGSMIELGARVRQAPGFICHVSGPTEGGYYVTEAWETREDWERWMRETIQPAAESLGIPPVEPQVREASNVITRA
jgi:hypothetical protein